MRFAVVLCLVGLGSGAFALHSLGSSAARERALLAALAEKDAAMRRLEAETVEAYRLRDVTMQRIDEVVAALDARRREDRELAVAANRPMPEGVRLVVSALQRCLVEDGYGNFRLLRATALVDGALRDVELIEHDVATFATTLYLAERLSVSIDLSKGTATLLLLGGTLTRHGERTPLPDAGLTIALTSIGTESWVAQLGAIATLTGRPPETQLAVRSTGLDDGGTRIWFARVDALLRRAAGTPVYMLDRFGDVADGGFRDVMLLAYEGQRLVGSIEAKRMSIRIDAKAGTVQVWVEDGVIQRAAGPTTIPPAGYGILLAGVTPAEAEAAMFGLVTRAER